MSKPAISGNPQSILVTAASVQVAGVDVGLVSQVKVTVKDLTTDVKTDQAGKAVVNTFDVGTEVHVEMIFDEYTAKKMKKAYAQATFITSGSADRISWGKAIGSDYFSIAQTLTILPTSDDVNYFGRRFTFFKAAPHGDSVFEYGPDKKISIKAMFKVFPDYSQPDGNFYGYFGDLAAGTLVPAAAGSPTYGGGNVGNGVLGTVGVNNTFTKTETWTLTCIHVIANSGLFSVVGSVTGARGVATVGSSFASNSSAPSNSEVTFTIGDGAIDWALGDTITFPTTVANFT